MLLPSWFSTRPVLNLGNTLQKFTDINTLNIKHKCFRFQARAFCLCQQHQWAIIKPHFVPLLLSNRTMILVCTVHQHGLIFPWEIYNSLYSSTMSITQQKNKADLVCISHLWIFHDIALDIEDPLILMEEELQVFFLDIFNLLWQQMELKDKI